MRLLSFSNAPVTSSGLDGVAKAGSTCFSVACVAASNCGNSRPISSAASAAITQLAPELLTATKRRPRGLPPCR